MWQDSKFYYRKVGALFILNWGWIMICLYRMGRWAYKSRLRRLNPVWYFYLFLKFFLQTITKVELPVTASIGKNLYLPHPYGLVMGGSTVIGNNCTIGPWVVIGHLNKSGNPTIGDSVYIGPKATILGKIEIGNNAIIGADALVVESVPEGAKALGQKAIIKA